MPDHTHIYKYIHIHTYIYTHIYLSIVKIAVPLITTYLYIHTFVLNGMLLSMHNCVVLKNGLSSYNYKIDSTVLPWAQLTLEVSHC